MRRRSNRPLSPEERQLWHKVTADIAPLPKRMFLTGEEHLVGQSRTPKTLIAKTLKPMTRSKPLISAAPYTPAGLLSTAAHSVLTSGDPRQAKRVSRGRREIDASVDLHGLTQEQAFQRLQGFLAQAVIMQNRCVLIITGKGPPQTRDAPLYASPRGVLRRRFLEWVDGPLSGNIASVAQAHQRHGGAGAFYVFLKRVGK